MIILNKLLYEVGKNAQTSQDRIEDEVKQFYNIYEQFETLDRSQIMIYFFVFFGILFLFSYIKISSDFLLAFIILVVIIYYFIQKDFTLNTRFIEKKNDQLKYLQTFFYLDENKNFENFDETSYFNIYPEMHENYLHIDPLLVEFFYQNREYSQNNLSAYRTTLLHVNLLLHIEKDLLIGVREPGESLEIARDCYIKAMNHFHSCIFSLTSANAENDRFTEQIQLLEKLLFKHLKNIFDVCEDHFNKTEISISSKPTSSVYLFTELDEKINPYFDFY
jgi:hypothetical protein